MSEQPQHQPGSPSGTDLREGMPPELVPRVHPPGSPGSPVTADRVGQVVVLSVADASGDVDDVVGRAVAMALADAPRGIVLRLPAAAGMADVTAVRVHAGAAAHVRDWAGVPVVLACPDPRMRQALRADPSSRYVPVTSTVSVALAAVLRSTSPRPVSRRLAPHPTAPRAARDFVTGALLGWGLARRIPVAALVVSELVTNAMLHAGTQISVGVATSDGSVRVTVRDGTPDLTRLETATPRRRGGRAGLMEGGRGLAIVAAVAGGWGVLPTADGGKVVWAVLNDHFQPGRGPRTEVPGR